MQGSDRFHSTQKTRNAGEIRKGDYIIIKDRPCEVTQVSTYRAYRRRYPICHFVGTDIFTGRKFEDIVPSYYPCDVPEITTTDYTLVDITPEEDVILLTNIGTTKNDLRLPTDETLKKQIIKGATKGEQLTVTVISTMGQEKICAVK